MLKNELRPWGNFSWVLDRLPKCKWTLLSSIATGDRSLAVWNTLKTRDDLERELFLQIEDVPSPYWDGAFESRLKERRKEFFSFGGNEEVIKECYILDNTSEIDHLSRKFIELSNENIIIDISTLPKRFFFPIIKTIIDHSNAKNIICTYTRPASYDKGRPLAVDPEPWREIPKFLRPYPEPDNKMLIIALGYEPLGLPQLLRGEELRGVPVHLLFPFPATPEGYSRNWQFLRTLDIEVNPYLRDPIRINAYDVSSIYETIMALTDNGNEYAIFAPYGTKPMVSDP